MNWPVSRTGKFQVAPATHATLPHSRCLIQTWLRYVHDNTDDEITHHQFLNAYLVSKEQFPPISIRFAL